LLIILGFLLAACSDQGAVAQDATPAVQANWLVDKAKSSIGFSSEMTDEKFTGSFSNFDAQINFNPDDLAGSKVVVSIDMSSADAGDADRNGALPGKEWFFVKSFPRGKFESTGFTHLGGDAYEVAADLTLRGVTKSVILPFSLKIEDDHAVMEGKLALNRRDYNIGTGMWKAQDWVVHEVTVVVRVEANKPE